MVLLIKSLACQWWLYTALGAALIYGWRMRSAFIAKPENFNAIRLRLWLSPNFSKYFTAFGDSLAENNREAYDNPVYKGARLCLLDYATWFGALHAAGMRVLARWGATGSRDYLRDSGIARSVRPSSQTKLSSWLWTRSGPLLFSLWLTTAEFPAHNMHFSSQEYLYLNHFSLSEEDLCPSPSTLSNTPWHQLKLACDWQFLALVALLAAFGARIGADWYEQSNNKLRGTGAISD